MSRNGGWESDVFETGLPFGGLAFCFFEEAVDAISSWRTRSCRVSFGFGFVELSCHVFGQSRSVLFPAWPPFESFTPISPSEGLSLTPL